METGGNIVLSGQQKEQSVPTGMLQSSGLLLWTMHCGFFLNGVYKPMDFDIDIGNDNEIFSSH